MAIVFARDRSSSLIARQVRAGRLVPLARGVHTDEIHTPPSTVVAANWQTIVGHTLPGAVLTGRSAIDAGPRDGWLFVDHPRTRSFTLPGLTVAPYAGPGILPGDVPLGKNVWLASEGRSLIENMEPTRGRGPRPARTLNTEELHNWLAQTVIPRSTVQTERLIEQATAAAAAMGRPDFAGSAVQLVAAATGDATVDTPSAVLSALQHGQGYDVRRVDRFAEMATQLSRHAPAVRAIDSTMTARQQFLPFFEAYFSNFIEGTEFTVDEALRIINTGQVPISRPADGHDILGTYQLVADTAELRRRLDTVADLTAALTDRHSRIMTGRPEHHPGIYKERRNQAGATIFVEPHLVAGTLVHGWATINGLTDPFARALMTMFVISEVHPFNDGNGRVARVMMNAELVSANQCRIIIPIVFRREYISALKAATNSGDAQALIAVMDFAQRWTYQVDFTDIATSLTDLLASNAFIEPEDASDRGIRLRLPSRAIPTPAGLTGVR